MERVNLFKKLYKYIRPQRKKFILLFICGILLTVLPLINPYLYKMLLDNVMKDKELNLLKYLLAGYALVYVLQTVVEALQTVTGASFYFYVQTGIRKNILRKLMRMPLDSYSQYSAGELKNRLDTDVESVKVFLEEQIIGFIFSLAGCFLIGCIMLYYNSVLALFGFLMLPLSFVFTKFFGKKSQKISEEYRSLYGEYEGFLHNSLQNYREIKSNNLEKLQFGIFESYRDRLTPLFIRKQVYWYLNRGFIAFKDLFITKMNLLFVGGLLIFAGKLTVGTLLAFMAYYEDFYSYVLKLSSLHLEIKNNLPALNRILDILDMETERKERREIRGSDIIIKNLCFGYPPAQASSPASDSYVLNNISLDIKQNERLAITGRSGCGKTTLIKLILGLYKADSGEIKIGGADINCINETSLHRKISAVMQDPLLFNMSIKENLLFAKKNAESHELAEACKKANILDFINSLPDKFETIIGERGIKLSGGQKQRLAIARVFLLNPDIIIFDEATSSLDSESEKLIVSAIDSLSKGKTTIMISHRESTIAEADRVYELASDLDI